MVRYYFFFSNAPASWLSRWMRSGFQHVEMLGETEGGLVFHVNPRKGCVDHAITAEYSLADCVARLKAQSSHVLLYRCPAPDPHRVVARGLLVTCSTYLAYSIGLPFFGATPYQLYKTLKRKGALPL